MKFSLERTPQAKGLIYKATDSSGKIVLKVERDVSEFSVWILYFRSENRAIQAVMQKDVTATEFQGSDGRQYGRLQEARFSVTGRIFVENEEGQLLGSVSSALARVYFKDNQGRRIGFARQVLSKRKFAFISPSKAHTLWNYEAEIEDAAYDDRLLYALVCILVTSEFASTGS